METILKSDSSGLLSLLQGTDCFKVKIIFYASIVEHDQWLIKSCWVSRTEEIENYSKIVVLLFKKNLRKIASGFPFYV